MELMAGLFLSGMQSHVSEETPNTSVKMLRNCMLEKVELSEDNTLLYKSRAFILWRH